MRIKDALKKLQEVLEKNTKMVYFSSAVENLKR